MTRLIGYRWKSREGLSQVVLINLFNFLFSIDTLEQSGVLRTVSSEECLIVGYIHLTRQQDIPLEGSVSGASSDRATPDPIPNSAVKPVSADGSLWQE